ncbi:MAG: DUF1080 domain-containing protein [Bacteroidota bacterium]|nr:DUF1080 domain-containing protein [Bacteroidota bacterium]
MNKSTFLLVLFFMVFSNVLFAQKNIKLIDTKDKSTTSTLVKDALANAAEPVLLFDDKTLNGWIQIPTNSWEVKDSTIASLGKGQGVLYTTNHYDQYRSMFTVRHVNGNPEYKADVLLFCTPPPEGQEGADALAGIQYPVPEGRY